MKKTLALIICAIVLCTSLVSCSGLIEKSVIGKWKFDAINSDAGYTAAQKNVIKNAVSSISLSEDGAAKVRTIDASWEFKDNGIVITYEGSCLKAASYRVFGNTLCLLDVQWDSVLGNTGEEFHYKYSEITFIK